MANREGTRTTHFIFKKYLPWQVRSIGTRELESSCDLGASSGSSERETSTEEVPHVTATGFGERERFSVTEVHA